MSFWCSKPPFAKRICSKNVCSFFSKHVFFPKTQKFFKAFLLERTIFTFDVKTPIPLAQLFLFYVFWKDFCFLSRFASWELPEKSVFFKDFLQNIAFFDDFLPKIWTSKWDYFGVSCFYHDLCVLWGSSQFVLFLDFSKYHCVRAFSQLISLCD